MELEKLKHLAHLARLDIDDETLLKWGPDLDSMLHLVDQLNELKTDDINPLFSPATHGLPRRLDESKNISLREDILKNAPETDPENHFFTVPKVIE